MVDTEENKKYEILEDAYTYYYGMKIYRIRALRDFGNVKKGDVGGYVEKYENLSHEGDCWIYDNAKVYDNAQVCKNAQVRDDSEVYGRAMVSGNAKISENTIVSCDSLVSGNAQITDHAIVEGHSFVSDNAYVSEYSCVSGHANVFGNASVFGGAVITEYAKVYEDAEVGGDVRLDGNACISGDAVINSSSDYYVFKNNWSSRRYFTYTTSNGMWRVGCFYGTGEELIEKAYRDSEKSGKFYEMYVNFVNQNEMLFDDYGTKENE